MARQSGSTGLHFIWVLHIYCPFWKTSLVNLDLSGTSNKVPLSSVLAPGELQWLQKVSSSLQRKDPGCLQSGYSPMHLLHFQAYATERYLLLTVLFPVHLEGQEHHCCLCCCYSRQQTFHSHPVGLHSTPPAYAHDLHWSTPIYALCPGEVIRYLFRTYICK